MSESNKVKETIEAVTGLVEAIPLYEDLAQPAAKELGKTLLTGTKLINMALSPVSGLIWGYEKIAEYLIPKLEEKLKNVPSENIVTPDPIIAVPTIEAMRYTSHKDELREMYANLLANSMNKATNDITHPSFVEIIKQLNSDEVLIFNFFNDDNYFPILRLNIEDSEDGIITVLDNFSTIPYVVNCTNPNLFSSYFENLVRLGLITISYDGSITNKTKYQPLEEHSLIMNYKKNVISDQDTYVFKHGYMRRTNFGKTFYTICVLDK